MTGEPVQWVEVGRVGRPHGLDGSFVVEDASEDPDRFAVGARVWVGHEPAEVASAKRAGGRLVVRLDRPVERGASLEVPASDLPPPEADEFYAFQLEGLVVVEESGRKLGWVRRVEPGVANDVLALDTGALLPFVEDCVLEVDVEGGRIVVATDFADAD